MNVTKRNFVPLKTKAIISLLQKSLEAKMKESQDKLYLLKLLRIESVGSATAKHLINAFGSAKEVFKHSSSSLLKIPGVMEKSAFNIANAPKGLDSIIKDYEFCINNDIQIILDTESNYPELLKHIPNSPMVLYQKGNYEWNKGPTLAIVGTRKPTDYGKKMAVKIASFFAEKGVTIVSGLAYGIDIEAHKAVLEVGGSTIGVLAHGLDQLYPSDHVSAANQMINNGALVSDFGIGVPLDGVNFPYRNRIIAGLSQAVIVVEGAKSGGAMITARFGFEFNREIYAVPGNLGVGAAEGCLQLIKENIASVYTEPQDLFEVLNLNGKNDKNSDNPFIQMQLSIEEQALVNILTEKNKSLDELMQLYNYSEDLSLLLLTMEMKNLIKIFPGKMFGLI